MSYQRHQIGRLITRSVMLLAFLLSFGGTSGNAQDLENLCMSEYVPLIEGAGLDVERSAPAFGCRPDGSGGWWMPTVGDLVNDPSYADLDTRGQQLLDAVDRMSMDDAFASSLRYDRQRAVGLHWGPGGVVTESKLNGLPISYTNLTLQKNLYNAYEKSMMTYLTRTAGDENDLVYYIDWYMGNRDTTLSVVTAGMNPMFASAYLQEGGYQRAPWPWQLADPHAIMRFIEQMWPTAEVIPTSDVVGGEAHSTIALVPNIVQARAGDSVRVDIQYPRLQGVTDVAFLASAEDSIVSNLPLSVVDMVGSAACTPGYDDDFKTPWERSKPLRYDEPSILPDHLQIDVSDDALPGDQLSVCIELIGFGGSDESLFSWNATATIVVKD